MRSPDPPASPAAPMDGALLDALRRGDEAAFERMFRAWYPSLVGAANAIVREPAVAEEVAQDVLFELWQRREHLDPAIPLRAYALRAARNRALNHVRHRRVEREGAWRVTPDEAQLPAAPSLLADEELESAIAGAVAGLPPRCREVFELSRGAGLRYPEIAARMGVSIKTVEAQMGKALRVLRERLAPWLPPGKRL